MSLKRNSGWNVLKTVNMCLYLCINKQTLFLVVCLFVDLIIVFMLLILFLTHEAFIIILIMTTGCLDPKSCFRPAHVPVCPAQTCAGRVPSRPHIPQLDRTRGLGPCRTACLTRPPPFSASFVAKRASVPRSRRAPLELRGYEARAPRADVDRRRAPVRVLPGPAAGWSSR